MTLRLRLHLLAVPLCASFVLASCGGGGSADDNNTVPPPAAAGCTPTRAGYDAVTIGMAYPAATAAMGCEGNVLNSVTVGGEEQTTYQWGSVASGAYVQLEVRAGRVHAKTARRLDSASTPSLCLATQASFDQLQIGMGYAAAAATLGCDGELMSEVSVEGLAQRSYAWGNVVSGPYVQLQFNNGSLSGRLAQRLTPAAAPSSCVPTRSGYDSVVPGLALAAVVERMGCAGQLLNDVVVSGLARQTYAWGNVASGPYAQITLDGGAVSSKIAQRLDAGVPANCTPTQARFDALASGATLASAQATMGCAGELVNEATVEGVHQVSQSWGSVISGPYVMVTIRDGSLSAKFAQRLDGTGAPSACLPTAASHAALTNGMSYAQASAAVGCAGQLLNELVTGGMNEKTFAWGDVSSGPYLQVKFSNGALSAKTAMRL